MTDSQHYGFANLVPGFDFLQNLAKGTTETLPQMPNLSNWVAPTLDVEELEKRIQELRAVHFWLDQNSKALGATIQALEVQKMTLATLKGMNCSMADLAQAMKLTPQTESEAAAPAAKTAKSAKAQAAASAGVIDPLPWWGSLTQQFQHIAASAMQEATHAAQAASGSTGSGARRSRAKASDKASDKAPAAKPRRRAARRASSGE